MNDSQLTVQEAIYTHLTTQLGSTVTGVFDIVPDNQGFPYVTIGDMTAADDSTQGIPGMSITVVIHTWDQGESRKRLKEIMAKVVNALHNAALTPPGSPQIHNIVNIRYEFSDLFRDPDGRTYHGVQRFRVITDEVD